MSKDPRIKAYVTGFILSLVFTAIPYYLMVTHAVKGSWLVGTILVFAILQMLVQIIFFLHLGRDPKLYWQVGFFVATVGAVFVVVVGSIWIMGHLHHNMTPKDLTDKVANGEAVHELHGEQVGTCPGGTGVIHKVVLENNVATPRYVDAKLCDTLMIINLDNAERQINFGAHDKHVDYAGEMGKSLRPGRNMILTLTETGTYRFHDHLLDEISGDFTVTP